MVPSKVFQTVTPAKAGVQMSLKSLERIVNAYLDIAEGEFDMRECPYLHSFHFGI